VTQEDEEEAVFEAARKYWADELEKTLRKMNLWQEGLRIEVPPGRQCYDAIRGLASLRREIDSGLASGTQKCPRVPFASTSERGIMDVPSRENQAEVYLPRATGESTRGDMAPLSDEQSPESGVVEPRTEDEHESAHLGRQ
jgi:hypothetical protein